MNHANLIEIINERKRARNLGTYFRDSNALRVSSLLSRCSEALMLRLFASPQTHCRAIAVEGSLIVAPRRARSLKGMFADGSVFLKGARVATVARQ